MESIFDLVHTEEAPARALEMMNGMDAPDPDGLTAVVVIATLCMVFMAWGIGANDVANSFATAFGAKCLTARQACVIAAFCELAGAVLLGGHVSDTIRKGMMSVKLYDGDEGRVLVMAGMTSVLLAAACWLLVASKYGLPVSTTHSAVGGVIAFAVASKGYGSVKWSKVAMIVASWFLSPTMAGVVGFCTYSVIKKLVLQREDSLRRAKIASPVLVFFMTLTVAMFTIYKGAKGIGLNKISPAVAVSVSVGISILVAAISSPLMAWHAQRLSAADESEGKKASEEDSEAQQGSPDCAVVCQAQVDHLDDSECSTTQSSPKKKAGYKSDAQPPADSFAESAAKEKIADDLGATVLSDAPSTEQQMNPKTEQMFRALVVVIAAFQSLAHGANDVANSVGPFGAVLAARDGPLGKKTEIPVWVFFLAGFCIVLGLFMYGLQVMRTIGQNITKVTPSKACCAQFAATLVVLLATRLGLPISTTHAAVGGVLGVGLADGVNAIDWKVMAKVFGSWIITLPICGIAAAGTYALFLPLVLV